MIKKAIDRVLELGQIRTITLDEDTYIRQADDLVRLKRPGEEHPHVMHFQTLTGLEKYIQENPDGLPLITMMIHVVSFNRVELVGPLQEKNDNDRFVYARAEAKVNAFSFGAWFDLEDFVVALQTMFTKGQEGHPDDVPGILQLLGNVASETVADHKDDGFSQSLQVKTGLSMKSAVKVENPVVVWPYRTFDEIQQPSALAVLRFRQQQGGHPRISLHGSDGGAWARIAMESIADWLLTRLPDMMVLA